MTRRRPSFSPGWTRFRTLKEARARRDFVAGEIAAGRNPADGLRALVEREPERTLEEWGRAMIASRLDVSEGRIAFLELALRTKLIPTFGDRVPREIRPSDVQEWVAALDEKLAARSVQKYWQALAQTLDFALGDAPNPARHKTVKLPYVDVEEATPPTADHFLAMLGKLSKRLRLPAVSSIRPRRVSPSCAPGSGKTSTSQTHGSARVA